ncbi:MAG TPA: hypothetical protein VM870_02330 [Pyrinomonadaceae bacterium]|jgi:cbb3-type cytochrome oxidase subunit 1|nr:hypothetical protein [Pyrinomonadaceae bacterium]
MPRVNPPTSKLATTRGERLWSFAAFACLAAAVVFWWWGKTDATFVAAALGVVAWFLRLRNRFRPLVIEAERDEEPQPTEKDNFEQE